MEDIHANQITCEISGSHGGAHEDDNLLGHGTISQKAVVFRLLLHQIITVKLYLVTVRFVIAAYCYIWNPTLKVVTRPVFKNWCLMWSFILDREVCKQYAGCI
jgi:hypothetical protein